MGRSDKRGQYNTGIRSGTHSSENRSVHNIRLVELELLRELVKILSLTQSSRNATENSNHCGHSSSAQSVQLIRVIKAYLLHLMSLTSTSNEQSDKMPADASSVPLNNRHFRSRQCPVESGAVPSVWMNNPQDSATICLECLLGLHLFRTFFCPQPGVKPQLSEVETSANDSSFSDFSRWKRNNTHRDYSVTSLSNHRTYSFPESGPNVFSTPSALSVDEDDGVTVIIRPIRHPKPKTHTRRSYTVNHSLNAQTNQQSQSKDSSTISKPFSNHPHSATDLYPVHIVGDENPSEFPKPKNRSQWHSRANSRPNFRIHS